jgi:hypothetical protein
LRTLYPPIEPYATHRVGVSGGHQLHVEEAGNPTGIPVLFQHGGPGGGLAPLMRQFFDPARYRIVLLDQHGLHHLQPEEWERFIAPIPAEERDDILAAYHRRLLGHDDDAARRCADAWMRWEAVNSSLTPDPALVATLTADPRCCPRPGSSPTTSSTAASSPPRPSSWTAWTASATCPPSSSRAATTCAAPP